MNRKNSFVLTFLILILFIIFQLLTKDNLEFRTEKLFDAYRNVSYFSFVILVALLAVLAPNKSRSAVGLISILIIGVTVFLWLFKTSLPETKIKDDKTVLLTNKMDTTKKIIEQVYYTGISWSNAKYDTVLIKNITTNIRWTQKINIAALNKNDWIIQK